jgi:hypothetical protein
MKRSRILLGVVLFCVCLGVAAHGWAEFVKVASFKDIGQSRAFFIAFKEEIPPDQLEDTLWEIVDYHMDKYGQAPQMWIYFFDSKKNAPKDFPIAGENLDHLIARYFYATDTRKKDLKVLTDEDRSELEKGGGIDSPLWRGQ